MLMARVLVLCFVLVIRMKPCLLGRVDISWEFEHAEFRLFGRQEVKCGDGRQQRSQLKPTPNMCSMGAECNLVQRGLGQNAEVRQWACVYSFCKEIQTYSWPCLSRKNIYKQ